MNIALVILGVILCLLGLSIIYRSVMVMLEQRDFQAVLKNQIDSLMDEMEWQKKGNTVTLESQNGPIEVKLGREE